MIKYTLDTPDPLGSFNKGVKNSLAIQGYNDRAKEREAQAKDREEDRAWKRSDRDYEENVLRPRQEQNYQRNVLMQGQADEDRKRRISRQDVLDGRQDTQWNQGQTDRVERRDGDALDKQAMEVAQGIAGYSPSARSGLLAEVKNPQLKGKVLDYLIQIQDQELSLTKQSATQLSYAAGAIMQVEDSRWNEMVPKLIEQHPGLAKLNLEAKTLEEVDQKKNMIMQVIGKQSGKLKSALTEMNKWQISKDRAKMSSDRKAEYDIWVSDTYKDGSTAGFWGVGAKPGTPPPDFETWFSQKYPAEYSLATGGGQQISNTTKPAKATGTNVAKSIVQKYMGNGTNALSDQMTAQHEATIQSSAKADAATLILSGSIGPSEIIKAGANGVKALGSAIELAYKTGKMTRNAYLQAGKYLASKTAEGVKQAYEIMTTPTDQAKELGKSVHYKKKKPK